MKGITKNKASKKRKLKTTWKIILSVLCVAVFGTTAYLLAQPGITWNEKEEISLKASSCPICGGKLDANLEWTPSTKGNPFGSAINYGLFMFGDLTDWNDTESNVAVLGNLVKRNMGITYPTGAAGTATGIPMPKYEVGLILGGTLTQGLESKGVNVQNGSIIASKNVSSLSANGKLSAPYGHVHLTEQAKINAFFEAARKDQIERNRLIYEMPANGTITPDQYQKDVVHLKGTDPKLNIFKISAEDYATNDKNFKYLYLDVPEGSTVFINVDGTKVIDDFAPTIMTNYDVDPWGSHSFQAPSDKDSAPRGQKQTQRILFNFNPTIETVNLNKSFYLYGSILAPNLNWNVSGEKGPNGQGVYVGVNGIAVLKSANGNGTSSEFHYNPFIPFEAPEDQKTSISVNKKWLDENNRPANAPKKTEIIVQLYRTTNQNTLSPNKKVNEPVKLNSQNNWNYKWTNLEKVDAQGKKYYYYVREEGAVVNGAQQDKLAGYEVIYQDGAVESGRFTLTNKKLKQTDVTVNKTWLSQDGAPQEPATGTSVELTLYSSSQYLGKQKATTDKNGRPIENPVKVSKKDRWSYTWKNLADKDAYGSEVKYTVEETPVDGYIPTVKNTGNSFTIENKEIAKYTVRGKKVWKNEDGTPMVYTDNLPQVKVQIYQLKADKFYTDSNYIIKNGKPYGEAVWLSSKNNWTYDWNSIPAYEYADGKTLACSYAVKELSTIPGFGAKLREVKKDEADKLIEAEIVNTKTETPYTGITAFKQWQNNSGDPIDPPEGTEIKLQLYQQLLGPGEEGKGCKVTFKFPGIEQTFNVKSGTTFNYTVNFMHKQDVQPQNLFSTKPAKNTYDYKLTDSKVVWVGSAGANMKQAAITGSAVINKDTTITFAQSKAGNVFTEGKIESWEDAFYPSLNAKFEKPDAQLKVIFTEKYGKPVTVSQETNWKYKWSKLPIEAQKNGVTYQCRYYAVEVGTYEGYVPSYVINGTTYDKLGPNVDVIPEGIAEGELLIVNKNTVIPGVMLPETGSSGTLLLMILGTALMAVPIVYYVFRTKNERRAKSKK